MAKLTHQEFVSKAKVINPDISVVSNYIKCKDAITSKCNLCGHVWDDQARYLLRPTSCPSCRNLCKSKDQFYSDAVAMNSKVTVLGEYINSTEKILVKCNSCGREFTSKANTVLRGHGCSTCGKLAITLGTGKLLARLAKYRPTIEVIDTPKLITDWVQFRCTVCGTESKRTVNVLLRGGCKYCSDLKKRKSNEKFLIDLKRVLPDVTALTSYDGAKNDIKVRCDVDGYEWTTTPDELLCSYGCKQCTKTGFNVGKTGYLYVYSFQDYCGFGITTNVRQRHLYHSKTFRSHKIDATLDVVYSGDGQAIWDVERHLKTCLPCYNTGVEGFKTEAILDIHKALLSDILNDYIKSGVLTIEQV